MPRTAILLVVAALLPGAAFSQAYPSKPVRLIAPYPPGGTSDTVCRLVAQKVSDAMGRPIVIENRPGAAGNVGHEVAAKSPPDGYTLILTNAAAMVTNQFLYKKLNFNPHADFAPISLVATAAPMLVVHPSLPVKTVKELVGLAKARPGQLNFGSGGVGTTSHIIGEVFQSATGVKMVHVPYKGSGESQAATLAGHVDLTFFAFSTALRHVKAGKLRAVGVGGAKRNPQAPDVPSISEVLPGYSAASWTGLFAPPNTPAPVVDTLRGAMVEILKMPDVQKRLVDAGDEPAAMTPGEVATFLREERQRWEKVIRTAGITAQ